jgi:Flp pilus assembly CpaE family ATPase
VYRSPSHHLRLALGLGDQELEQRLRPALDAADDLVVVAQCLAADQLVQAVEAREVDAIVLAWSLHRLTEAALEQIERSGLPVVLLVPDPDDQRWSARRSWVVGLDAQAAAIRELIVGSRRAERVLRRPRPAIEPVRLKTADQPQISQAPGIIAITGGVGSPGRTTVAVNLAAALGAVAPTVLVEVDFSAPAVAAYLDRDPSRNLCTLAHAVREDPHAWSSAALADELQPLSPHSGSAWVLCGPPKREMRASIAPAFVERLVAELAQRYRYVLLDVGPELLGMDTAAANHRAALASAHQVMLVSASNLVGLWHARTATDHLERQLGIAPANLSLVLNRHDARFHHARAEVAWHLGTPIAAVVPDDRAATERAIAQQRPLVVDSTSRASRALLGLAERVHNGRIHLPPEDLPSRASWWRRLFGAGRAVTSRRSVPPPAPRRLPTVAGRERQGQVR